MGLRQGKVIVKVQRSLNNGGKRTLIYNKDRSVLIEFDTNNAVQSMLGLKMKGFFEAEIEAENIALLKEVKWRDW